MEMTKKMLEESISERFSEIWQQLSRNQRRYVVASQEYSNKKDAALAIRMKPDTIYRWPPIVDEAVELMSLSVRDASIIILAEAVAKAAMIKVTGLDSDNEKVRQDAATEVLDRVNGKPSQHNITEVSGTGGGAIVVQWDYPNGDN